MWGKYEDLFSQKNRNIPGGISLTTMQLIIYYSERYVILVLRIQFVLIVFQY